MKKLFPAVIILLVAVSSCFGEDFKESPFLPVFPQAMAQGGASSAIARGYDALFLNPAGFTMGSSITFALTDFWMYANPALAINVISGLTNPGGGSMGMDAISDQISGGGLGIGGSVGAGYVSGGLGLGGALVVDSMLHGGRNAMDATGDFTGTLGLIGGYAMSFKLTGLSLSIGADLRPMYRIHARVPNTLAIGIVDDLLNGDTVTAFDKLNGSPAVAGLGLGIDIGAIAKTGPFLFSLSVRDLYTHFAYTAGTYGAFTSGSAYQGVPVADQYYIPMNVGIGAAFHPDLGKLAKTVDPVFMADLQDVVGVFIDQRSLWTLLHLGAEADFFQIMTVRVGLNQGYITFGGGVHLSIFDLNFAVFTRELGQYIGDQPNSGLTVELALRT